MVFWISAYPSHKKHIESRHEHPDPSWKAVSRSYNSKIQASCSLEIYVLLVTVETMQQKSTLPKSSTSSVINGNLKIHARYFAGDQFEES